MSCRMTEEEGLLGSHRVNAMAYMYHPTLMVLSSGLITPSLSCWQRQLKEEYDSVRSDLLYVLLAYHASKQQSSRESPLSFLLYGCELADNSGLLGHSQSLH